MLTDKVLKASLFGGAFFGVKKTTRFCGWVTFFVSPLQIFEKGMFPNW